MPIKARIKGFQSLEDITIDIDKFTVITGANNTGKSALMRAIRGAFQNTKGNGFIRHGCTKTTVDIDFGDGHSLTWEKGKGKGDKPTYIIDGGDPIYPGQGVPDEVAALGVRSVPAGSKEIWPQMAPQFTGQIFLLDQPGSVMAEAVADIEHVTQLNEALRMAASDKRSATSELHVRKEDCSLLQKELVKFEGLEESLTSFAQIEQHVVLTQRVENAVQGMHELRNRYVKSRDMVGALTPIEMVSLPDSQTIFGVKEQVQSLVDYRRLSVQYHAAHNKILSLQNVEGIRVPGLDALQELSTLQKNIQDLQKLKVSYSGIKDRIQKFKGSDKISVPPMELVQSLREKHQELETLKTLQRQYAGVKKRVTGLATIEAVKALPDLSGMEKLQAALQIANTLRDALKKGLEQIKRLEQDLVSAEMAVEQATEALINVVGDMGACPVCGSVVQHSGH